jgi:hypothetical protein
MSRPRTIRRQLERDKRKLDDARWKLAMLGPGFAAARPFEVESASQIEPQVRGMRCPACEVPLQVVDHAATSSGRDVTARCPQCGKKPHLFFVIRPPAVN